VKGGENQKIIY